MQGLDLPSITPVQNTANQNLTGDSLKQQQINTVTVKGNKKIVPVVVRSYTGDTNNCNPFVNPFHNQMLRDDTANVA